MPHLTDDCPQPPRRFITDHVLRRFETPAPAWEARRGNKIKERFPTPADHQPLPCMNLVAPVQPTIGAGPFQRAM